MRQRKKIIFLGIISLMYLIYGMAIIESYNRLDLTTFFGFHVLVILFVSFLVIKGKLNPKFANNHDNPYKDYYYQSLFQNNPSLVFLLDNNGRISDVNKIVGNVLNYPCNEILSKKIWMLFSSNEQVYIQNQLQKVLNGNPSTFMAKIINKDGKEIHMECKLIPIVGKDGTNGLFFIGSDSTELLTYKDRIIKSQIDLRNTVRQQQGMIFKYIKMGDSFIHTLCDGQLVNKIGLHTKEVVGKRLHDFMPASQVTKKILNYRKAWSGEFISYEGELNGVNYLAALRPVFKDGRVIEVIGSCIDISDRKKVEEELRKKENLYRTVLSTMSDGIFLFDTSYGITTLNENVERILGIRSGRFTESTMRELGIQFVSEDGEVVAYEDLLGEITKHKSDGVNGVVMGVRENGLIKKWISVNARPLLLSKDEQNFLVSFYDISIQKEQELKLKAANHFNQTLIDSVLTGIFVTDKSRKILLMNMALKHSIGIDDSTDAVGKNAGGLIAPFFTETENFTEQIKETIKRRQPDTVIVKANNGKNFKRNYMPIMLDDQLKANLWTYEDITELSNLQKSAIMAKEDAEKANMAKSDFLSKMSHELRSPLNGILGFAQLLELENLDERQRKFAKEILKSGEHLLTLINEIRDLSRIEAGKIKVNLAKINIGDLIYESVEMLGPLAERRKIKIHIKVEHSYFVNADTIRLRQVLLNLIDNAIKYNIDEGKVEIYIHTDSDRITVFVKDTGIGIPAAHISDIFEPFYRIKKTNVEGTGIGLSLTKQLVQLMGGFMGVINNTPGGSRFWFNLPLYLEKTVNKPKEIRQVDFKEDDKDKGTKIILYIEDNPSNIELMQEIIESQSNYSLLIAQNGMDGLSVANEQKVDLVLLDMDLPDMNGHQVFDEFRKEKSLEKVPVIALSANAIVKDIQETLDRGIEDYVTKPFNIGELLKTMKKYL